MTTTRTATFTTTETTARRYYNKRDRLGRFVKVVQADQLRVEGGWHTDEGETTHAHDRCGNIVGEAVLTATADGWLCTACIETAPSITYLTADMAQTSGHKDCETCRRTLRMTSFPTYVDSGYRMRGDECRGCRDARKGARRSVLTAAA